MASDFYPILKEILGNVQRKELAELSVKQIELTMGELDRRLNLDCDEISREFKREEGRIVVDAASRGLSQSTIPSAAIRQAKVNADRRVEDLKATAAYLRGMWDLEKKKMGVGV